MLMVLMSHCIFLSNGCPSIEDTIAQPFHTFYYALMQSLCICCVDCFILISGYFGINTTWRKVTNLLCILIFWKICIFLCFVFRGETYLSFHTLYQYFKPTFNEWFVYAYFGLMFMAPILNTWFDKAPKKQLYTYTIIFFAAMMLSLIVDFPIIDFKDGYSAVSLCGIYILGRIYRRDIEGKVNLNKTFGGFLYIAMATVSALWFVLGTFLLKKYGVRGFPLSYAYCSPIVILQAMGVLIFFSKLQFQSKIVNHLAVSAFSVYLIHSNILVIPYFTNFAKTLYQNCGLWMSLPSFIAFSIIVYIACCVLDRIRITIFGLISKYSMK